MFNIGFAELIVVLLVAFLIVGPKDLPKVARWIARQLKAIRKIINEMKNDIGWKEIKAEFEDSKADIEDTLLEADISTELKDACHNVQQSFDNIKGDIKRRE